MTTPLLPFDAPTSNGQEPESSAVRLPKPGHVRATSVQAYRELGGKVDQRAETVLQGLIDYAKRWPTRPTVGELARFLRQDRVWTARGMSELGKQGRVEAGPARRCNISRRSAHTWRVKGR